MFLWGTVHIKNDFVFFEMWRNVVADDEGYVCLDIFVLGGDLTGTSGVDQSAVSGVSKQKTPVSKAKAITRKSPRLQEAAKKKSYTTVSGPKRLVFEDECEIIDTQASVCDNQEARIKKGKKQVDVEHIWDDDEDFLQQACSQAILVEDAYIDEDQVNLPNKNIEECHPDDAPNFKYVDSEDEDDRNTYTKWLNGFVEIEPVQDEDDESDHEYVVEMNGLQLK